MIRPIASQRDTYERTKERARAWQATASQTGRDIAPMPACDNPARRREAAASFRAFCEHYFGHAFTLAWSPDHLKAIARIEQAVISGGLFSFAMPRGSGKTTLAEYAALWATATGRRPFVMLIGANADRARAMLQSIKTELETNDELLADWPEVCYPIRRLERINHRARGQTFYGQATGMVWTNDRIILPTIPGSQASGAVIGCAGIDSGNLRGQKFKQADGTIIRPSLVLLDDPQTRDSARSIAQTATRESVINGDVLGMAGPGKKISGLMACTVIEPDDLADTFLDRGRHPEWKGERTKMVYAWPTDTARWDEYAEIRRDNLAAGGDGSAATKYYADHREAMDAGARVAWPERFLADEISALQHAVNLRLRDPAAFASEYQNEPLLAESATEVLSAAEISTRRNGRKAGEIPAAAQYLTAGVDVHDKLLFWAVCAWSADFTGQVIDYGTYPKQSRGHFTLRNAKVSMAHKARGAGREGAIHAGLLALLDDLTGHEFVRDDGAVLQLGRVLVDAGYLPDVVGSAIRAGRRGGVVMPARGLSLRAANKPFSEYKRKRGQTVGWHWMIPAVTGTRQLRTVNIDVNHWKTFMHARLATAAGDPQALTLFGGPRTDHTLFAAHLAAEFPTPTEGHGRVVNEWKLRPGGPDNHWLDCVVGATAAASMLGAVLPGVGTAKPKARRRVRLSDIQARKRSA